MPSLAVLYPQIQFNRAQVDHLQLIKYGVYGIYASSYKKLGTRTLVRSVISIITLFLGKNRFNLHHSYLQCLFQESEDSLLLHIALPSAMSSCPSGSLCSKDICGSLELPEVRPGKSQVLWESLKKKNKYKIQSDGHYHSLTISLELER